MADQSGTAGHALMQQMGITTENIERRKLVVGLCPDDLARIAAIRDTVAGNCEQYTSQFFDFLASLRSEEHTSELQSPCNLVCRLLLEKKKKVDLSLFAE